MKSKKKSEAPDPGKIKFYRLDKILSHSCQYNVIFGQRSNGKTFSVLEYAIKNYWAGGGCLAYMRRFKEDITGARAEQVFDNVVAENRVSQITDGAWTGVYYRARKWYLSKYDEELDKEIHAEKPFAYGFALNSMESDKGLAFPDITTVLFDEFMTRSFYLIEEFVLFSNALSTIIRHRNNVTIFMCANTVNRECPYFREMGLSNVSKMKPGDLDVYEYGDSGLRVAVQYSDELPDLPSNVYFAFNNPKLKMITNGAWELPMYPHLPMPYKPKEVVFEYFIKFYETTLHCEIICADGAMFTYIHAKTTPIKDECNDLVYSIEYSPRPNYRRNITKPQDRLGQRIFEFFKTDRVFYQTNEIGDTVRNYLVWCATEKMIKA